jgi:predicted dehydrogenase
VRRVGVVLLGQGLMGRVHATALRLLPALPGASVVPELVGICGRDREALTDARRRFGWTHAVTDWRELLELPGAELLVVATPNGLHAEPSLAAVERGMHVLCEKPLAPSAAEAEAMWQAAAARPELVCACAFNHRCLPAPALARELVESGAIGEVRAFRSRFLMAAGARGWRRADPGGVLPDLGVPPLDRARRLAGEPEGVAAVGRGEDALSILVRFAGGATGTVEAARAAGGQTLHSAVEVDGSRATLSFDLRRPDELRVADGTATRIVAAGSGEWWPAGHPIGWFESFVLQLRHVLAAIAGEGGLGPAATFADGYRCALACDAVGRALASGSLEPVDTHVPVSAER